VKALAALLLLALAPPALAGKEGSSGTRGGGTAIATYAPGDPQDRQHARTVRLIDLSRDEEAYEGIDITRVDYAAFPELRESQGDAEALSRAALLRILGRIQDRLPHLAKRLADTASTLGQWIPSEGELPLVGDHGKAKLRPGEKLVQVAIRQHASVIYDTVLYDKLDALNRAALRLHEWVYALSSHPDAGKIQRFVALALSEGFAKLADAELEKLVREALELGYSAASSDPASLALPAGARSTEEGEPAGLRCGRASFEAGTGRLLIARPLRRIKSDLELRLRVLQLYTSGQVPMEEPKRAELDGRETTRLQETLRELRAFVRARYPVYLYPELEEELSVCVRGKRLEWLELQPFYFSQVRETILETTRAELERQAAEERWRRMQAEYERLAEGLSSGLPLSEAARLNSRLADLGARIYTEKVAMAFRSASVVVIPPLKAIDRANLARLRVRFDPDRR
jgi:hypothetical protein